MTSSDRHTKLLGDTRRRVVELLRREPRTVQELAEHLELTPNGVRAHISALQADRLVRSAGVLREGVGKPASLFELTLAGEALFPKAYGAVLDEILVTLEARLGREITGEVLRETARRMAASVPAGSTRDERIAAARRLFESLGALVEVQKTEGGLRIQGYACPLGEITPTHPEVCEMLRQVLEDVVREPVHTACRRNRHRPRCAFEVRGPDDAMSNPA